MGSTKAEKLRAVEDPTVPFCSLFSTYRTEEIRKLNDKQTPFHSHSKAQILLAYEGVISVETDDGKRICPPNLALWIPANIQHGGRLTGVASTLNLYFSPELLHLPRVEEVKAIPITPFLRSLCERLLEIQHPKLTEHEGILIKALLGELRFEENTLFFVPNPKDPRLKKIVALIEDDPATELSFEELARKVGASPRNLARLFQSEIKMTFTNWRRTLRTAIAIDLLAKGSSITDTAFHLGFQSSSAFSRVFKEMTNQSPSHFRSKSRNSR